MIRQCNYFTLGLHFRPPSHMFCSSGDLDQASVTKSVMKGLVKTSVMCCYVYLDSILNMCQEQSSKQNLNY